MADIRDILKALDDNDRQLYSQTRTEMRKSYINALAQILGLTEYDSTDDAFLDLIDIKIAVLFDRSGRFNVIEGNIDNSKAAQIEKSIEDSSDKIKLKQKTPSQTILEGWR